MTAWPKSSLTSTQTGRRHLAQKPVLELSPTLAEQHPVAGREANGAAFLHRIFHEFDRVERCAAASAEFLVDVDLATRDALIADRLIESVECDGSDFGATSGIVAGAAGAAADSGEAASGAGIGAAGVATEGVGTTQASIEYLQYLKVRGRGTVA